MEGRRQRGMLKEIREGLVEERWEILMSEEGSLGKKDVLVFEVQCRFHQYFQRSCWQTVTPMIILFTETIPAFRLLQLQTTEEIMDCISQICLEKVKELFFVFPQLQ